MVRSRWGRAGRWLGALLFYMAATAWLTWPLVCGAGSTFFTPKRGWMSTLYQADLALIIWIQRWVLHALATNPLGLLDANAFHPVRHVLVRSEFLFGSLPIFAPTYWLTGNPVLALNVCVLTSFVLAGFFMFLLVRRWTGSTTMALIGGLTFAFAPWRIPEGLGRPHLLQAQYLPLVFLGLERTAATGRRGVAVATALVMSLQVLCSSYHSYFVVLIAGTYVVVDLLLRGVRNRKRQLGAMALAVLPPIGLALLVALPHAIARARGDLPTPRIPLMLILPEVIDRWVGIGTALLALGALPLLIFSRRDRARTVRLLTLILLAGGAWVIGRGGSPIGGVLSVYMFLRDLVPGMTHIRAPQRFSILASFAASCLTALTVAAILAAVRPTRWNRVLRPVIIAAAVATVLLPVVRNERPVILPVPVGEQIAQVYGWLAERQDRRPLLELPMDTPLSRVRTAAFAQYFSTYHWLPLLNGHTGYVPPQYDFVENLAKQLPSAPALQLLVDCTGVGWVLDHHASIERSIAWNRLPVRGRIFRRSPPGQDWLFDVRMPPRGPCAQNFYRTDVTLEGNPLIVPAEIRGSLHVDGFEREGTSYQESQMLLTFQNTGTERWPCTSVDVATRVYFTIDVAAKDEKQTPVLVDDLYIPHDVGPGETIQIPLWGVFPGRLGEYTFRMRPMVGGLDAPNADRALTWKADVVVGPQKR